ncbi:MAG TPA: protein kinase, partial [Polyangiaceae bacterium]
TLTKGGAAIGSPSYMAPEQIRAAPNLDARADIWSLGTILFELLTGRCPFEAETIAVMYQKVLTVDPPSLLDFLPDAPSELNTIIQLCLQKDAEDRFQSVQELAMALRSLVRPPVARRARLESGVELIAAPPEAQPPGVSLSVKFGLFATASLLAAASLAFWQLQLRSSVRQPASMSHQALPRIARSSAANPPPSAVQTPPSALATEQPGVTKPEPPAASVQPPGRPAPVHEWPAPPRKPGSFSAGTRYGL